MPTGAISLWTGGEDSQRFPSQAVAVTCQTGRLSNNSIANEMTGDLDRQIGVDACLDRIRKAFARVAGSRLGHHSLAYRRARSPCQPKLMGRPRRSNPLPPKSPPYLEAGLPGPALCFSRYSAVRVAALDQYFVPPKPGCPQAVENCHPLLRFRNRTASLPRQQTSLRNASLAPRSEFRCSRASVAATDFGRCGG